MSWPFGGIFCLTFFREGCSPCSEDDPPLAATVAGGFATSECAVIAF